jgi:hypothetical protein
MLFDWLIVGQVLAINPAPAVRGPKHVVKRGKILSISRLACSSVRTGRFPSDNHAVRFGVLSPGLEDISKVTAHRWFGGHVGEDPGI